MKKINYYIFFVLAVSFVVQINAQQDPYFSLYQYNRNVINPAYAGSNGNVESLFGVRSQWVRVQDAPETFNFNINFPFRNTLGAGLTIVSDQVFVLKETHVYIDFSYKLQVAENMDLFLGLKSGGSFLNVDLTSLSSEDPLFTENVNNFNPNVGVGFFLQAEKFYVSLSAPGLLRADRFEKNGVVPVEASDEIHFYGGAGYEFDLSDAFTLRPSFLTRVVSGAPTTIDLSLSTIYKQRMEFGVNHRLSESFSGFFTIQFLNSFRIGYAFERATTEISQFSSSTHEIILKLILNKKQNTVEMKRYTNL